MVDRRVIEWEKDDLEALKIMKVDILGVGMLGCMRRAFDLLAEHKGQRLTLASPEMQEDDPEVFDMICEADTIGTFQIESRAQMSMLPRLRPRIFYDIVIQVAIVRPGPIQGNMVHPYLRRREGKEPEEYPSQELKEVLGKTKGVPLFQEQAMKVAIVGAGFSPARADALRRSMATFKTTGGVSAFHDDMVEGMVKRGYARDFAERTFKQIEGFGSYGFPESHAASFAKIAYASSWMKHYHPEIFCAALLNAQPMGFYAPAQLVRDAREHGVEVRPVCVNASRWDCTLEEGEGGYLPLRLGLRMVKGLSNAHGALIAAAAMDRPFASIEEVMARASVPAAALEKLADADAFACLGLDRRQALWRVRGLGGAPLPLFAAAEARGIEPEVTLTPLTEGREVVEDYRAVQLSLRRHPLAFLQTGAGPARHHHRGRPQTPQGRRQGPCRGHRPGPPAPRQGQCHLHHPGGRDRHRQRARLAAYLRGQPPDHPRLGDDRGLRHPAARRQGHPYRHRPARGSDALASPGRRPRFPTLSGAHRRHPERRLRSARAAADQAKVTRFSLTQAN